MLIDWFTVAAQAINFLILVWLLKRFLYRPILDAIDAREKRIAAELADADAIRIEANQDRDEFRQKNEAFEQQRQTMLTTAMSEAHTERQRLMEEARKSADALRSRREEAMNREHLALTEEITRKTQEEVFAITRKALTDLADASLEEQMAGVFVRRLQQLDDTEKKSFAGTPDTRSNPMIVRSAFELPDAQRAGIQTAIQHAFSVNGTVKFEAVPNVVSGIELTSNGRKISWSIASYLASMEQRISELLQNRDQPIADAEIKTQIKV